MPTPARLLLCGMILVCAAQVAGAQTVSFELIPNASGANDMSPDGRYIVGQTNAFQAYLLDTVTNEMTILPPEAESATAVSDDGSVVLGDIIDPETNAEVAAIWTSKSAKWTSLGYLPNAQSCPSRSNGYELSADGSVAVGLSWDGCSGRGFRWTQATGMVELQNLANGNNRASVCSGSGNVIGGFAQGSFSRTPAFWGGTGQGQLLDPPNGDATGEVHGINGTGTIMLGEWNGDAVKWANGGAVRTILGAGSTLPGWTGIAMDIANNGTAVGFDILIGNRRAWIQPNGGGSLVDLKTYIVGNGGTVPSNIVLQVCQAISTDGTKIIGHGFATGAWLVRIQGANPCAADIAPAGGDDVVNIADLLAVVAHWGEAGSNVADVNGDGIVNVSDMLAVIGQWGPCPAAVGACCTGGSCTQVTQATCQISKGVYLGDYVPCSTAGCANNDHCENAVDITANINAAAVPGDNSTATPPFGGGDPELPSSSPSCHWNQNPEAAHSTVWYTFTAPDNGSVTIATCSSISAPFFDSTLALYTGSCGSLVEAGCDEDGCDMAPPWYSRLVATRLIPGQVYRVCVMNPGDYNGSVPGPFTLSITSP